VGSASAAGGLDHGQPRDTDAPGYGCGAGAAIAIASGLGTSLARARRVVARPELSASQIPRGTGTNAEAATWQGGPSGR